MLPVLTVVLLFLGLLWAVQYWFTGRGQKELLDPTAVSRPVVPRGELAEDEKATIEIFREASQSVVHISTANVGRDFFSFNVLEVPRGTGSGFV